MHAGPERTDVVFDMHKQIQASIHTHTLTHTASKSHAHLKLSESIYLTERRDARGYKKRVLCAAIRR